ncbi:hypothetical protein B0H14DRAFT_3435815 [Mycena olivaceomarginata]|nr:hypothetical protein B0H14DRAFT_3435815 [Mycena olivaceomarginata]
MAGTGKSTIAQTFCEHLDHKNMLGASFFCSRAAEASRRNARFIIPSIAYSLAGDSALAESNYYDMTAQFKKLIVDPIRNSVDRNLKIYKVVVIDALDECSDIRVAASFI